MSETEPTARALSGPELDARVAEKMGYPVAAGKEINTFGVWFKYGDMEPRFIPIPEYSTDIAAAWQIVERYKLSLLQDQDDEGDVEWMCGPLNITGIGNRAGDDLSEVGVKFTSEWKLATTAPHAICLAFLALDLTPAGED